MEAASGVPRMPQKGPMYLYNIVKYHASQLGVMALLALFLGLITQISQWVSGLWWVLLLAVPLFASSVVKVATDPAFIENHEIPVFIGYTLSHLLIWCELCGWVGRGLVVISCFSFVGLLVQMTFVQAAQSSYTMKTALGLSLSSILLMWFCAQIAVLPTWSVLWMGTLTCKMYVVCMVLACLYIVLFTVASFNMCEDRSSRAVFMSLGAESILLWKYYFSVFSSVRSRVQQSDPASSYDPNVV